MENLLQAIEKALGWKRITAERLRKLEQAYLRSELETYTAYLNGDVFGFVVETEDGEELDSCWGYYDRDDCERTAQDTLAYFQTKENERAHNAA